MTGGDPRPPKVKRRSRLRPRPVGQGPALIAMVVAVVIFIGLVVWYAVHPGEITPRSLSDLEVVFQLGEQAKARYPQVPGPAQAHVSRGTQLMDRARAEGGRLLLQDGGTSGVLELYGEARESFRKGLAVSPDDAEAVLGLAELALRAPGVAADLPPGEDLLAALAQMAPEVPGLERARALEALVAGDLSRAREHADRAASVDALELALELAEAGGQPAAVASAAVALLRQRPGDRPACAALRRAVGRGAPVGEGRVEEAMEWCNDAPSAPALDTPRQPQ